MSLTPPRSARERFDWLRLARSENIGPATFRLLLQRYGDASSALDAVPLLAQRGGRRGPIALCRREDAEREMTALSDLGGRFLMLGEADYPPLLAAIEGAPPVIAVLGQAHLAQRRTVAIVGARNASAAGIRMARRLATDLGQAGFVAASGLARGIDAEAHRCTLETGSIAVLAGGLDVIYPPEHANLYKALGECGLILSEMPLGTAPQARHFPRRNRLISGLSEGVIVIEAAERSGSLITARFALEQGREVLAVPGSPLDPRAQGTNKLIRAGATLIQSAADAIEVLDEPHRSRLFEPGSRDLPAGNETTPVDESELAIARDLILERLGPTPIEIDELIRQTGFSAAVVLTTLLELELAGRLERLPGQRVGLS